MVFLRGCYHQILGPRRHLPKYGRCRHSDVWVRLDSPAAFCAAWLTGLYAAAARGIEHFAIGDNVGFGLCLGVQPLQGRCAECCAYNDGQHDLGLWIHDAFF
jgi:hypothetical protein